MKLDNKGWGTGEMLLLSAGLLLALLVSVFFIHSLYSSLGKTVPLNNTVNNNVDSDYYKEMENDLIKASINYINKYNIEINDTFKVSADILRLEGYIGELKDQNNNSCTGYVRINNESGIYNYYGYIKCKNYTTKNYEN